MILPDFILTSRSNLLLHESGIDTYRRCTDKNHFRSFPYNILYKYNSRGFRDEEWPIDVSQLKKSIWCFGDSFTVGIGSPIEHTWVNILQSKINTRCINISLDGASNDWIYRKVVKVLTEVSPDIILIQWSFLNRKENPDATKTEEDRRESDVVDLSTQIYKLKSYVEDIEKIKNNTKVIYSTIPNYSMIDMSFDILWDNCKGFDWPDTSPSNYKEFLLLPEWIKTEINYFAKEKSLRSMLSDEYSTLRIISKELRLIGSWINEIVNLDFARDGFHYDKLTATVIVDRFIDAIQNYST